MESTTMTWQLSLRWFRIRDIALLALFYWGVTTLLYSIEKQYVWSPVNQIVETPDMIPIRFEDIWFEASDGVKLHGLFYPNLEAKLSLLFCL